MTSQVLTHLHVPTCLLAVLCLLFLTQSVHAVDCTEQIEISVGDFSCGIHSNNEVECWGYEGTVWEGLVSTAPTGNNIRKVATGGGAGGRNGCVVQTNGEIFCWGSSHENILNDVPTSDNFVDVCVGYSHVCGLTDVGEIQCWGREASIKDVPFADGFSNLSCGKFHTCALRRGSIRCFGSGTTSSNIHVRNAPEGDDFIELAVGDEFNCALKANNYIRCWGNDAYGGVSTVPVGIKFTHITVSDNSACGIMSDTGFVRCWGNSDVFPLNFVPQSDVIGGDNYVCAVDEDKNLTCWIQNGGWDYWDSDDVPQTTDWLQKCTAFPTSSPSMSPSTSLPTASPSTSLPTASPSTSSPTTSRPSWSPTTSPSWSPTNTSPSSRPTMSPTTKPSTSPTNPSPMNDPLDDDMDINDASYISVVSILFVATFFF